MNGNTRVFCWEEKGNTQRKERENNWHPRGVNSERKRRKGWERKRRPKKQIIYSDGCGEQEHGFLFLFSFTVILMSASQALHTLKTLSPGIFEEIPTNKKDSVVCNHHIFLQFITIISNPTRESLTTHLFLHSLYLISL